MRRKKVLLERALPILQNYYGKDHPQTASTLTYLGNTYAALGDAESAKALLERALVINEYIYGTNNPMTARIFENLANISGALGSLAAQTSSAGLRPRQANRIQAVKSKVAVTSRHSDGPEPPTDELDQNSPCWHKVKNSPLNNRNNKRSKFGPKRWETFLKLPLLKQCL